MRHLFSLLCVLVWASMAQAQDAGAADPTPAQDNDAAHVGQPLIPAAQGAEAFPGEAEWNNLSARVEAAIEAGRASSAILSELRYEISGWRAKFQARQGQNAGRIATVEAQLAALGAAAADDQAEAPAIATLRATLTEQLGRLRVPVLLANEAYAQADGLIGEIDSLIRTREVARFSERSVTPLNPAGWPKTWNELTGGFRAAYAEFSGNMSSLTRQNALYDMLPALIVTFIAGVVALVRGGVWISRLVTRIQGSARPGAQVLGLLLSIGQVVVPFLGVVAICFAFVGTDMLGRRLDELLFILMGFAFIPIVAHWLASQMLPEGREKEGHPLDMDRHASLKLRWRFIWLGYVIFLFGCANGLKDVFSFELPQAAVLVFPAGVLLSVALYQVGRALRIVPAEDAEENPVGGFRHSLRNLISRVMMLAALTGLVLAALGYLNAFALITSPAAMTLFVLATLSLLHRLISQGYAVLMRNSAAAHDGLIPVLFGFVLVLAAMPVLALIWGAQTTDITELWTRFSEGFSIGETVVSPRSFMLFAVVFLLGYTATRLLQGALRSSVLPRTKLDLGARNAVVSGIGYLGIFLAAVIAITTAGIDLSGLAIVAGALSVGIGFGLQNIVSNFVSGIILLIERPISQGDWIEVGGQMGYVRDISVRSTRIETFNRTDVIVPNADLVSGQVTNWTRGNSVGRVIVPIGVAYGSDIEQVTRILESIAKDHPMVLLNPGPSVVFQGFGASSLDFEIRAILRDVNSITSARSQMNYEIARRFAEAQIEIPFPQQDIWLRNPETLRPTGAADQPQPPEASDPGEGKG